MISYVRFLLDRHLRHERVVKNSIIGVLQGLKNILDTSNDISEIRLLGYI